LGGIHSPNYDPKAYANGDNAAMPNALAGDLDCKHIVERERPWHRTIVNMAAAGYNNREIAKMTGRHTNTVENTLRQPWAREYLITEAKKTVQDEIKAILESEALPSIRKLVAVRDGEGVRPSDVITASNSLLDRFLGKPVQPMTTDAKPVAQLSDEELRAQVQAELTKTSPN
jgi:lambda repressor-like predicted transcriptional regulator